MVFGGKRQIGGIYAGGIGGAEAELDTSSSKGYTFLLAKNTGDLFFSVLIETRL